MVIELLEHSRPSINASGINDANKYPNVGCNNKWVIIWIALIVWFIFIKFWEAGLGILRTVPHLWINFNFCFSFVYVLFQILLFLRPPLRTFMGWWWWGGILYFIFYSPFPLNIAFLYLSSSNRFLSTLLFLEQHVFSLPCSTQNHLENMFLPQIHFATC